jgi:hypothetical protein
VADPLTDDDHVRRQRRHLRRILLAFVVVVVAMPLGAVGGAWALALVPALVAAALAVREAVLLRRSVRRHGDARGR